MSSRLYAGANGILFLGHGAVTMPQSRAGAVTGTGGRV